MILVDVWVQFNAYSPKLFCVINKPSAVAKSLHSNKLELVPFTMHVLEMEVLILVDSSLTNLVQFLLSATLRPRFKSLMSASDVVVALLSNWFLVVVWAKAVCTTSAFTDNVDVWVMVELVIVQFPPMMIEFEVLVDVPASCTILVVTSTSDLATDSALSEVLEIVAPMFIVFKKKNSASTPNFLLDDPAFFFA